MKEAVSGILIFEDQIFCVKRNVRMKAFAGYTAFPGGKVDAKDDTSDGQQVSNDQPSDVRFLNALKRELKEELNFDLNDFTSARVVHFATAITPSFNPYRFKTLFYKVYLKSMPTFTVDENEAELHFWITPKKLLADYNRGNKLMVPPTVKMLKALEKNLSCDQLVEIDLHYDEKVEVPYLEPIKNIYQLMPLSKTFPPANRTNSFLLGDGESRILVDPSPQDEAELSKYLKVAQSLKFNKIFLTHHHPDHHQFAPDIARKFNIPILLSSLTKKLLDQEYGRSYLAKINLIYCSEGDVVCDYLNEDVYCVEVPGHDNGQLALTVSSRKWFLVGDLIQTIGTVVVGGDNASMSLYFDSLQKVIDFNPQVIFPSHGIALGGVYKLEKTLEHRKWRERDIQTLLKSGNNELEIMQQLYPNIREGLQKYALSTIKAHIVKILKESDKWDNN